MYVSISSWNTIGDKMKNDKLLDKIAKKIDQIEKMHDKESILCEEVKDLLAEMRENQEDDFEEDQEDIDEEDDK